ncbi:LpxA family transferase [Arenibacter sp. GZD96]|uniref:hypothetical protein n=1 Tax=Aurantibrevibacter litoralis TaxID=3106030 RepID=UPI002AFF5FA2|nr:hypothetical protein [Arenibacter sp. GZD-96]MEA1784635.1 LpxA family transferase [Arenibacter sp. GZD-96]
MITLQHYFDHPPVLIPFADYQFPWEVTSALKELLENCIAQLGDAFMIRDGIAIHKSATIEKNVTFKRPVVIMEKAYVAANTYFREGVFLDTSSKIGPGCEVKCSVIGTHSALAHFNYVGNSLIGAHVNFEAGSIAANHYNERDSKEIHVHFNNTMMVTGVSKFGALVGDHCKIGANAVLSPGTVLAKNKIIRRLELVEQIKL